MQEGTKARRHEGTKGNAKRARALASPSCLRAFVPSYLFFSLRAFVPLFALFCVSCGYQQSGDYNAHPSSGYKWRSLYREDIQTVAVPIFQNKDFHRGIEFSLTRAVIKQLEA